MWMFKKPIKAEGDMLDETKFYIGKLCKRGHEYGDSGGSLRYKNNRKCCECVRGIKKEYYKSEKGKEVRQKYQKTEKYKASVMEYSKSEKRKERRGGGYDSLNESKFNSILYGDSQNISILYTFLKLLSCKNIGTEIIPTPVKLNNKRKKNGKHPIFSYKTLIIKPTHQKEKSMPKHLWNNRIHLSSGHFKTYTEETPLFGKITGRFWWQPRVRGKNRDGVVMKDYKTQAIR